MKKSFVALVLVISQQSAMAETLKCTVNGDAKKIFTVAEDVPQVGLATLSWASGDSSVVTFSEKTHGWGCYTSTEKTYAHSDFKVNMSTKEGLLDTRCGGTPDEYYGLISAVNQPRIKITCTVE
ncbi:hypothetical protein [Bdellovibrio sp. HCB2-146]|uniref:hypothetical protein n=1 Tax=Bdellovibrio sp. HCB2-146 TaxID=3394362 RepID=UPI0039BC66ED